MMNEVNQIKKFNATGLFILLTGIILLINPVSAAGGNVPVPHINQGSYVFIGESGLDNYCCDWNSRLCRLVGRWS
jgi:hypothetical protein